MPNFNAEYAPAEAERGKFVPLTQAELTSLGMTTTGSRGRYAILTVPINSVSGAAVVINNPPNVVEVASLNITTSGVVSAITFANTTNNIEFWNNSSGNVYLYWETTTYSTISSRGFIIEPGTYYSVDQSTKNIWLGAEKPNADIRIFNHYIG